jgi:hypothetical protein
MLSELSRWLRSGAIAACGLLGLVVAMIASGHSPALALAVTDPADGGAIETALDPPSGQLGPAAASPGAAAVHLTAGNPLWALPLKLLNVTAERPLFSPSRRPPPPPPVAVVAAPPAPPPPPAEPDQPLLTLVGTVIGDHESIGIFFDQTGKKMITLKTGQDHDGWTLRDVRDRKTVFDGYRREAILALPARDAANVPVIPDIAAAAPPSGTWKDGNGQIITLSAAELRGNPSTIGLSSLWTNANKPVISPPAPALSSGTPTIGSSQWTNANRPMISPPAPALSSGDPTIGSSKWTDANRPMISPPAAALSSGDPTIGLSSKWTDANRQMISPTKAALSSGDRNTIGSMSTSRDGDVRSIAPPPQVGGSGQH